MVVHGDKQPVRGVPEPPPDRPEPLAEGPGARVVPLNDAAAVYEALAAQIRGSAVGWSDDALAQLERGLLERYGPVVGGRHAVRRLVRLARRPDAA